MAKHPRVSAVELGDQSWASLADAVRRLEDSWRATPNPELAQFVPPAGDPLHQRVLVELIKVDQEYRWQAGQQKKLETYLSRWPELSGKPEVVKELLEAECLTRAVLDKVPTPQELQSRFPEISEQIDLAVVEVRAERERASGCNGAAPPGQSDTSSESLQYTPSQGGTPPPLAVGERFGRYEIRGLLGEGGMAAVYRAYDTQLGREVALKIPQFDPAVEPTVLERFVREARAAAAIRHANICPIYDAGQIDGTYYIAMALIEGQSLAAWMQGREVAPLEAVELLLKLAAALAEVHRAGIVHRDIKPSNVMIDQSGEPLLMDFGLARQAQSEVHSADAVSGPARPPQSGAHLTGLGSLLGTPAYMSPEQAMSRVADARSDVHGLGVLLYQMLTGKLPFGGEPLDLLRSIAYSPPPPLRKLRPELDAELEAVCLKAMAKDPADRYQSAGEMAEALERYLQGSPQVPGPPSRRRRLAWISAAAGAVLFLAGVVIYLKTGEGTLVLEVNEPDVKVTIDGKQVEITSPRDQISVKVGHHQLEVSKDGFHTQTSSFSIRRGGRTELSVRLEHTIPPTAKAKPTDKRDLVLEDFSSDPFERGWVTNNKARYFWDSATRSLRTENYTNSGEWATTNMNYNGESFHLEFDVKPAERNTGDVIIGLFGPKKLSMSGDTEEKVYVLLGGYKHEIFVAGCASEGDRFASNPRNRLMVDNQWHHIDLDYDSTSKSLDFRVTINGASVFSWQRTMNHGFSSDLSCLGVSMKGEWVTSGRYERAYIDNVKMSVLPLGIQPVPPKHVPAGVHPPTAKAKPTDKRDLVLEDFSSDPFERGWVTNNKARYFWDSASRSLRTENYTNSGDWATTNINYNGESFHLEFDVKPAERDTGDVCVGLFGPKKGSNSADTKERVFVLLGGYKHEIFVDGRGSEGYRLDSNPRNGLMVDNQWHHIDLDYDSTSKSVDFRVTRNGASVFSWQTTMNHGFSSDLSCLGVSMKGDWVTSGRYQRAYIDNVKMSVLPLGIQRVPPKHVPAGVHPPGKLLLTIPNPTPDAGDEFGHSVASVGNNILVGALFDDAGATNAGAAYLFDGSTGKLLHTFQKPTPAADDRFGYSVAGVGNNVLVGAPHDRRGGAAYLFDGSTGELLQTFRNPTPGRNFGNSVAPMGRNVLIGAYWNDTGAGRAGTAYLFDGTSGKLLQTFRNPDPAADDQFGYRVAAVGNNVVVTAPWDDVGAPDAGAAYLFDASTGDLLRTFRNPQPDVHDLFGVSLCAVGNNVLVGAPRDHIGGVEAGATYLLDGSTGNVLQTFHNPTPAAGDLFGGSVAAVGKNVLVGARHDGTAGSNAGAAYLFDPTTGKLLHTFVSPSPTAAGGWFGHSVAGVGNKVLVAAHYAEVGGTNAGAVYLFAGPRADNRDDTGDGGRPRE